MSRTQERAAEIAEIRRQINNAIADIAMYASTVDDAAHLGTWRAIRNRVTRAASDVRDAVERDEARREARQR